MKPMEFDKRMAVVADLITCIPEMSACQFAHLSGLVEGIKMKDTKNKKEAEK